MQMDCGKFSTDKPLPHWFSGNWEWLACNLEMTRSVQAGHEGKNTDPMYGSYRRASLLQYRKRSEL
jgi:hypothetical protein